MSDKNEIPQNVLDFLDVASARYGQIEADKFHQFAWADCRNIKSPIEQLFVVALNLVCAENYVTFSLSDSLPEDGDDLTVIPQLKIGSYFIDFVLLQLPRNIVVCVELDGHQFHDRNEKQRRYEKARDRFLVSKGLKVIHFTGSEVVKDPCAVALEAFNLATGLDEVSVHPLDNS